MLLALGLAVCGIFLLSRSNNKSPMSVVVLLVLLGLGVFVFNKVTGGVLGGLQKQLG